MRAFDTLFEDLTHAATKIKKEDYLPTGRYPIIDQGQSQIAGYTDREDGIFEDVPAIIFGDHTRKIKYVDEPFFLGADGVKLLKCKEDNANYKYLYYALCNAKIPDTGYNRHFKWLKETEIEYPDPERQTVVVSILDKLSDIISRRNEELQKLDTLIKARFVEMFGDPLNGTEKWPMHIVGDVADSVDPQPSHRTPPIDKQGIPYVSIKDCDSKTGNINFSSARKVSRTVLKEHLSRYQIHEGDFVIGKIGTIGKPIFLPERNDYTLSANVVLIQPFKNLVSPYFLKFSFESAYVERQSFESKNSTSQSAFGIQKVRQIRVMNPDIDVQRRFEAYAKQVDKSKFYNETYGAFCC